MTSLFLDKPAELEKRIDRLVDHFRHAENLFFTKNPHGLPSPRDLLWLLIEDAVHTARSMPFQELRLVQRVASALPATRDTIEAATFRENARLEAGMNQYDTTVVRVAVNESSIDRMVDILDLFRFVVGGRAGKDAIRMKRVVQARAAGLSIEQCGRVWDRHRIDFDRRSMHDIKSKVLGQILQGIERTFGLVRTSRSFRRLTMREIEARKKARRRREREAREEASDAS